MFKTVFLWSLGTMANQKTTWTTLFDTIFHAIQAYSKHISIAFFTLLSAGLLFFGYQMWITKKTQAAQYDFSSLITEYETALTTPDFEWDALLEKFNAQCDKHASAPLLPYYQAYKVQILLQQNKRQEALALLDFMIAHMTDDSLTTLYEMERAMVQLDDSDTAVREIGVATLKMLAHDTENIFRDSAQYYLGRYYWAHNQIDDARTVWQLLVDEQHDEKLAPSPWVAHVQDYLTLTVV
jgi:predicted negative regulator of RcsB-dependent stress response